MNTNQNSRPSDSLFRLQDALVAVLRTRINLGVGSLGLSASLTLSKLAWWLTVFVLFLNVFLFGNIALGFYLGHLYQSTFLGFGLLTLFYLGLLFIAVLIRRLIQARIQAKVARTTLQTLDKMNVRLDGISALRIVPEYREVVLRSAAKPIEGLERRVMESSRRAAQAQAQLMRQIDYLRLNYKRVVADVAEQRLTEKVPAYRFVAGLINRTLDKQDERKKSATSGMKRNILRNSTNSFVSSLLEKSSVILPYVPLVFRVVRPVLVSVAVSKSRNFFGKLFGLKKKF